MESRRRHFERAIKILRVITETDASDPHKLPNKYEIFKALEPTGLGTAPTFLAAVDELEEAGLIRASLIETQARGGRPSKHYDLTVKGLDELLGGIDYLGWKGAGFRKGAGFSTLARRYSSLLPEIFGLWERYRQQNVPDIVERSIISVCTSDPEEFEEGIRTLIRWKDEWLREDRTRHLEDYASAMTESWRKILANRVFLDIHISGAKIVFRWLKALKQDPELAKPYLAYLKQTKSEHEKVAQSIDTEIRGLETSG
jgi:hypothetical protein